MGESVSRGDDPLAGDTVAKLSPADIYTFMVSVRDLSVEWQHNVRGWTRRPEPAFLVVMARLLVDGRAAGPMQLTVRAGTLLSLELFDAGFVCVRADRSTGFLGRRAEPVEVTGLFSDVLQISAVTRSALGAR